LGHRQGKLNDRWGLYALVIQQIAAAHGKK